MKEFTYFSGIGSTHKKLKKRYIMKLKSSNVDTVWSRCKRNTGRNTEVITGQGALVWAKRVLQGNVHKNEGSSEIGC